MELVKGMPVDQVSKKILRVVEDNSRVSKGHASKASKLEDIAFGLGC